MKNFVKKIDGGLTSIFIILVLVIYFISVILKYPLMGIEVEKRNNQWIIVKTYKNVWVSDQLIEQGNIVKFVNGEPPENHATVKYFNDVEMANSISVLDKNSKIIKTFLVTYKSWDAQYITYLVVPLIFMLIMLVLSVFLYRKKKDEKSAKLLIYFLLALGTSYFSASVSARGDLIGYMVNTVTFPGVLILFIHFLTVYVTRFDLQFVKSTELVVLYILNCLSISLDSINILFELHLHMVIVKLLFFLLLIGYLIAHLIRFYIINRHLKGNNIIKILLLTLLVAFGPFVCFYLIPTVLGNKELLSAEFTAIFLLVIPMMFVYLQLAEKLFDIDFLLGRIRYYMLLAFPFSLFVVFLLSIMLNGKVALQISTIIFLVIWIITIVCLYVKEYIDYKFRHRLFSPKNHLEKRLYTFFQQARHEVTVKNFIANLKKEMKDVLMVQTVLHVELTKGNEKQKWFQEKDDKLFIVTGLENVSWDSYPTGSLFETTDGFGIVIGGDHRHKHIMYCSMKKSKTNLNIQERVWLETLAYFSSVLLENFQLIEDLVGKIEEYQDREKTNNGNYPLWFCKLMFSLSEKERTNLSIDLHDSVLQEQLQLLRDIEMIRSKVGDVTVKNDLMDIKEKVLDSVHLIRETCNELRPPFLSELGIVSSLQILIDQIRLRADFIIKTELDSSIQRLHHECELTLYRLVQELLNNAIKHSLATEVKLSLYQTSQSLFLEYSDDGKGIDMEQLNSSFKTIGIFGVKERVRSIGGTIDIHSSVGQGMQVFVELQMGGSTDNDTSINSG